MDAVVSTSLPPVMLSVEKTEALVKLVNMVVFIFIVDKVVLEDAIIVVVVVVVKDLDAVVSISFPCVVLIVEYDEALFAELVIIVV